MALSAADLQKRHELEGVPDPFPSLADPPASKTRAAQPATELDTSSEAAFPSLAPVAPAAPPLQSAWSTGPRLKVISKAVHTDSFTLSAPDLSAAGKDGKPTTLGEVMKQVMLKYTSVKLEASANQKTRQTTFHIKSESEKELEKAKKSLLALLSPITTLVVNAPASTIAAIIGPKGAQLKQIRDQTGVKVDIPRKDSVPSNGQASVPASGKASPSHGADDEDDDGPSIPITLSGPQPLVYEAQSIINDIIASKTSTITRRVRDIEHHVLPHIIARRPAFLAAAQTQNISLGLNQAAREITVSGDREAVIRVVSTIKSHIDQLKGSITQLKISLPKPKHRLLVGKFAEEILAKSKCSVVVPTYEDPSEDVCVWGLSTDLPTGLAAVMEQANSKYIHEFPLPGPAPLSRQLLEYFLRIDYPKTLHEAHPDVLVFTPTLAAALQTTKINVDLVGEKSAVDAVVRQVSELIGKLIGAVREVSIDWLLHRIIIGKNAKKLKAFHEQHNVNLYWPNESEERSTVLLVYDPFSLNASPSPDDKKKHLDDAQAELQKMAKAVADVKSQTISVEKRWHEAIVGYGGTTLNAIIGEDKTLSIKFGAEIGEDATEDQILIRGASSDVERAVKEINKIVENAKNDEIDNSHSTEFEIDREYVGRIVGAQGAGINKLRDLLGVKVLFDDNEEREKESGKRKKTVHLKSKVKITGRKENVEEAKKRIIAQVERLADETQEVLKIPSQYHASLIGQNGKYAIRLEEKYGVKITFPRNANTESKSGEGEGKFRDQKPDEVYIKGGKKGVSQAKNELLDALEFEKESNNTISFTVPTRSVSRILGKGGAQILEIRDETGAQIDVEKVTDGAPTTTVTARGPKKAIAAAKTAILAIADQVAEEITETLTIENKFHRSLIGAGGQGLRDLITRCGGPIDAKAQAGLVRFPRAGDPSDEVRLRGESKLVKKLKAELEKAVAVLRDRVILGVEVPAAAHRNLIGRGGQTLSDFQKRTGTQVQFPGSRSYDQVGEPENIAELENVERTNLVKVSGTRAACEAAVAELKQVSVKAPSPEDVTSTATISNKYYYAIIQQGQLSRTLRNHGVFFDQNEQPPKPSLPSRPPPSARIDEEDSTGISWEVIPNYQNADEGTTTLTLKAKDQAALDQAQSLIQDAINHAEKLSHIGFLTLSDRSSFPRIVGTKGANVARLRNETDTDITVSRDNNTITIIGSEDNIVAAKEAILRISSSGTRSPRRRDHD
ncbi:hypothetical protein AX16_005239 [Volvariella volvacea WC 439]|nr:hypothetical protein AX16_005239 [Volvariella volvacea WC 439]